MTECCVFKIESPKTREIDSEAHKTISAIVQKSDAEIDVSSAEQIVKI